MSYTPFKRQDFAPSCPSGGTWWACGHGTYFVGCCARDPCDITCAQGNLYPGAFNPTSYGDFPDATCGTGSKFYTCTAGATFWGCCKTNACSQSGCPDGDLEPAILNREDLRSAYHASGGTTLASATRTSTASASIMSTPAITSVVPPTSFPTPEGKQHVGAIAGGAAGGAFGLALIIGLVLYYCCHAKKSRKGHADTVVRRLSDLPARTAEKDKAVPRPPDAAPPGYSSPNPEAGFYPQVPSQYGQYGTSYAYTQQQQQAYPPEPQELPIGRPSPVPFALKPAGRHRREASELSGDTAIRSELDTPLESPKGQQKQFAQPSPLTPQTRFEEQSPRSVEGNDAVQSWMAQQNLQAERGGRDGYGQGLGVQGVSDGDGVGNGREQRGYGNAANSSMYHGI
ncbi:uncharacterized protein K460DRAFT_168562 [Cucurbitaria berberidis CBS 394.84]|uniref:Uncharacterized protein n=1 Tax=Cucurbitaria berberidis CBS 394.84 TaxID=1168544 RepID=A0A9P4G9I1_9PLEO|nr:uncharacterized protein K460DRAFT_168562 [Cucurbitaria berberidis CBS 394.84]KAF1841501.1 hypothetical protein K460DRAFT_168562 [Cucurbitaria berberidis CBS 394.84]